MTAEPNDRPRASWSRVVEGSALVAAVLQAVVGDREALVAAGALVVGVVLIRVGVVRLGRVLVGALLVNLLGWMVPAAWSNATHGDGAAAVGLPVLLVVAALTGLTGLALGSRLRVAPRTVVLGATAVAALGVGTSVLAVDGVAVRSGDLEVDLRDLSFEPAELRVGSGAVGIVVSNDDLFWHTFTVDALGVDVRVPVHGTRRLDLDVPPGRYEVVCRIPGHEDAGMTAVLVVVDPSTPSAGTTSTTAPPP